MSYDISCNCSYMPLHHLRNKIKIKEKKRNQIKENKKNKIKIQGFKHTITNIMTNIMNTPLSLDYIF